MRVAERQKGVRGFVSLKSTLFPRLRLSKYLFIYWEEISHTRDKKSDSKWTMEIIIIFIDDKSIFDNHPNCRAIPVGHCDYVHFQ